MFYYAKLNTNNICECVIESEISINKIDYIVIESLNADYVGRKYINNSWSNEEFPIQEQNAITLEEIAEETLLETKYQTVLIEMML